MFNISRLKVGGSKICFSILVVSFIFTAIISYFLYLCSSATYVTKIETLELIAKKLNISVMVFFDENTQLDNALPLTDSQFRYFIEKVETQAKEIGRLEQELDNLHKKSINTTGAEGAICADAVG